MTVWNPERIVVGVDGSDQGMRAARVGIGLARQCAASMHLVTVVRPPEGWWGLVGSPPPADALSDSMARAQRTVLDETVAAVASEDVDIVVAEEIGDPASALSQYCEEVDAGLLVVGRRGAGIAERLILGSVADRLAHHAPCVLMIVP